MPFVTEELWQKLPRPAARPDTIALCPYPTASDGRLDADAEQRMDLVMTTVTAARSVRSEHDVHPAAKVPLTLRVADAATRALLQEQARTIATLVGTEGPLALAEPGSERPRATVVSVAGDVEVLVGLLGLIDPDKETQRVERSMKKVTKDIEVMEKRLANQNYVKNAPAEVVAEARALLEQLKRQLAHLLEAQKLADELRTESGQ
jgi:valyl-tRNA synthetase